MLLPMFSSMFSSLRSHIHRPLAVAAVCTSILTVGLSPTSANAAQDEVIITISEVTALDPADVWLAGPDDFYARVTINGQQFTTPIKRQKNNAKPNWKISKLVPRGKAQVRLEIFDKDLGKADDKIDINRVTSPKRDLDFRVDTKKCTVLDFSQKFRCGDTIRRAGNETKKAEIVFFVDVKR